jgi:hypothetical protein
MRLLPALLLLLLSAGSSMAAPKGTSAPPGIQWPWVYPAVWKLSPGILFQPVFPSDSGMKSVLSPGIQADIIFNHNFLIGLGLEYHRIAPKDSFSAGRIIKPSLCFGFMIPLDDIDIHHLVLQFNPALSMGKFRNGSKTTVGYTLGVQYEFTLFSNHILAPGIFYSRFPPGNLRTPSLGRWSLGFKYIIGK